MLRRRALTIIASTMALAAWPVRGQKDVPRVTWFSYGDARSVEGPLAAFTKGLQQHGYVPGRDVAVDVLMGDFSQEKTHQLADELVARPPRVVVAQGYAIRAIAQRTTTIPIVSGYSGDIVEAKLVASHARPGGNITGVQFLATDLVGKRMELLRELLPQLARVAVIADPGHAGMKLERAASQGAADKLQVRVDFHPAHNAGEIEPALDAARAGGAQALVVFPDSVTLAGRDRIAAYTIRHRLPSISGWDSFAEAGLLLMYGPNLTVCWGRLAYYVDRILKGANPADLPIEMPTTVETIVNLRTAKAIGIAVPQSLLLRADRVID